MPTALFSVLPTRSVLKVSGEDRVSFLQGLVSNDVAKVTAEKGVYGAFLTPQGKFLYDLFMIELEGAILLDVEAARIDAFFKKLRMYKMRSDVSLENLSDQMQVGVAFGGDIPDALAVSGGVIYQDPRIKLAGHRAIVPMSQGTPEGLQDGSPEDYDAFRIGLGLPESNRDLIPEKSTLVESGFVELNGIDWQKGCYMGQELTARTHYRGLVKKRLVPMSFDGDAPEAGTDIVQGEKVVGDVRSTSSAEAIVLVRVDALDKDDPMVAGGVTLTPQYPTWMSLPQPAVS